MKLRDLVLSVHRWVGLTAGLIFCVASLTGAALVFGPELDALVNRSVYPVTAGDIGIDAAVDAALAARPGGILRQVRIPDLRYPVYRVDIAAAEAVHTVAVDPGSGRAVEPTRFRIPLYDGLVRLHASLLLGPPGGWLVTLASFVVLFGMIAGLILWWPGIQRFLRGFVVRRDRSFYVMTFDLHQVAGALSLPVLFLITLTGVLIHRQSWSDRLVSVLHLDRPWTYGSTWEPVEVPLPAAPPQFSPSELFARAVRETPGLVPRAVGYPDARDDAYTVTLYVPPRPGGSPGIQVVFDGEGQVLQVRDPRALPSRLRIARHEVGRLHRASFAGLPPRLLYFVVCLVGGLLVPSGIWIWWYKRSRAGGAGSEPAP